MKKKAIVDEAKKLVDDYNMEKRDLPHSEEMLRDFRFMQGVDTLAKISSCVVIM